MYVYTFQFKLLIYFYESFKIRPDIFFLLHFVSFLEAAFENCHKQDPQFDVCMKDALNQVRPYFKTGTNTLNKYYNENWNDSILCAGVPEWRIPPFDPFFSPEVVQNTGIPMFNYKLRLLNVTESGWTASQVTSFRWERWLY